MPKAQPQCKNSRSSMQPCLYLERLFMRYGYQMHFPRLWKNLAFLQHLLYFSNGFQNAISFHEPSSKCHFIRKLCALLYFINFALISLCKKHFIKELNVYVYRLRSNIIYSYMIVNEMFFFLCGKFSVRRTFPLMYYSN